jgi:hypothetical protein
LHTATGLKYENHCSDPVDTFRTVTEFINSSGRQSLREIGQRELKNANDKFKQRLTSHQQRDFDEALGGFTEKVRLLVRE